MKDWDKNRRAFTMRFLRKHVPEGANILDLGDTSKMANMMRTMYAVRNTGGYDLDIKPGRASADADAVTSFEVFEHLLNPFGVLRAIQAPKLVCSVPLSLWFVPPYRGATDRDWHYHEFHDWQFDWLLDKTGWRIIDSVKLCDPKTSLGLRPLLRGEVLRYWYPRYYFVCAVKK